MVGVLRLDLLNTLVKEILVILASLRPSRKGAKSR